MDKKWVQNLAKGLRMTWLA